MGQTLAAKRQRNYLLDVAKLLFTILCITAHYQFFIGRSIFGLVPERVGPINELTIGSYMYFDSTTVLGIRCYTTIAIFTFLSGYWMLDHFKRQQHSGWIGKGQDFTLFKRYFAKTYAGYWPFILFGISFGFIFWHVFIPKPGINNLGAIISNFLTGLPQFLGIFDFGGYEFSRGIYYNEITTVANVTNNFAESTAQCLIRWNGPLWYMFAIIVCLPAFYAILIKSESLAVGVVAPTLFIVYNYFGTVNSGFRSDIFFFIGPSMLGVWGWYFVDWLKRTNLTAKARRLLNLLFVVTIFLILYNMFTNVGGMVSMDLTTAFLGVLILAQKDSISIGLNKLCGRIPLINFAGTAAVGIYVLHFPICLWIQWAYTQGDTYSWILAPIKSFGVNGAAIAFYIFMFVLCIPFYFIEKHWLKKLASWILRISKANEPIILNKVETA